MDFLAQIEGQGFPKEGGIAPLLPFGNNPAYLLLLCLAKTAHSQTIYSLYPIDVSQEHIASSNALMVYTCYFYKG